MEPEPTKDESPETKPPVIKREDERETTDRPPSPEKIVYFECTSCSLREAYEYFGHNPPWTNCYELKEDAYMIQDPFVPRKEAGFIVLGAHCRKCNATVCTDGNCSFYFGGYYCVRCAKSESGGFPKVVQEKLNRIVVR